MVTRSLFGLLSLALSISAVHISKGQEASHPPEPENDDKYVEELIMHRAYQENRTVAPYSTSTLLNSISIYQRFLSAGQCQFYPSCSRYAYRSIENLGLVGLPMAAERLMRCHPWAHQSSYGKIGFYLYDPPRDFLDFSPAERHRTSTTYLRSELISEMTSSERTARRNVTMEATKSSTGDSAHKVFLFGEDVGSELKFGCALYREGEFFRAVTEFKRYLFLFPTASKRTEVLLLIACSLYKSGRYAETHSYLNEAYVSTHDMSLRDVVRYVDALSYYSEGEYEKAVSIWKRLLVGKPNFQIERNSLAHLTLACLELGDKDELRTILADAETKDDSLAMLVKDIRNRVDNEPNGRSPLMATIFSAVLPGSGQVYSGRFADGMVAFVINGLFTFLVVDSFKEDYTTGKVIGGLFGLQFYLGNVLGANRAAHIYNQSMLRGIVANVRDSLLRQRRFELELQESNYYMTLD